VFAHARAFDALPVSSRAAAHAAAAAAAAAQGLAAGLMLSISIMELLPDAISEIGFVPAQMWFYAGVAFFAVVVAYIPEPDASYLAAAVAPRWAWLCARACVVCVGV
jgi:zinc transporter ZupT